MSTEIAELRREVREAIADEFERQRHHAFVWRAQVTLVAVQVVFWAVLAATLAARG